ncbi:MAG TPA: response regulator [bacterium]|nr:response regulator [bacterium]
MSKQAKKILIAEDERAMAKALELKLRSSGFDAKSVFNGEDAVKELEKEHYDLLLLDIMMPIKDGFFVLEEIKNKNIKIPVIISSNLSQEEDVKKAKNLGAIDYFIKSNTPIASVIEHVKNALKMK